jgi:hypothetical protein
LPATPRGGEFNMPVKKKAPAKKVAKKAPAKKAVKKVVAKKPAAKKKK